MDHKQWLYELATMLEDAERRGFTEVIEGPKYIRVSVELAEEIAKKARDLADKL